MTGAPLVVTLGLDTALQARLDRERGLHFPAHRNLIPAHVSLFHHLPAEEEADVAATLQQVCGVTAPFPVRIVGVMKLGRGTAYRVEADGRLHAHLARAWHGSLTAQDRQAWKPHVTIQNKVEPTEARALHLRLSDGFVPFDGRAETVKVWRYLGGPWEPAFSVALSG